MGLKIILTGATGFVGEGVLLECLNNNNVDKILVIGRKGTGLTDSKIQELVVPNFFSLHGFEEQLKGYDAVFYCAGISSVGMQEAEYTKITVDTPLAFAHKLLEVNPDMVFCHVSGLGTDASEKGKVMWARVKGRAENELAKLPFKKVYNFRPGFMKPTAGQQNVKTFYRIMGAMSGLMKLLFPKISGTVAQVGQAMINSVTKGYDKQVLEVADIKNLAAQ
ncbi:hypothetical protein AM493_16850 [Flavobacterium akiainvivens]|uniref:NAD-dependent epimerase/dehydratase domain-containing protein n=1 Tax=Flavobacterium akiainvivens TaxID=1202724 RepID=A0A0M8MK75_9FLAO|nr:NAD-dependent epimerase/dehydratase family protein [Flavobacterium akiainvivens]KOS07527.1 hypothetical protein AM493_16850 [Flavobacterium akiainvivens]SFQ64042.1 NAD dependent epimerase/dehydratase family protein [Flavobacterium akiainvivens]